MQNCITWAADTELLAHGSLGDAAKEAEAVASELSKQ
jgi:hypothetical protein